MTTNTDPRPHYRTALAWVRDLAAAVPADRLTDPTPCPSGTSAACSATSSPPSTAPG